MEFRPCIDIHNGQVKQIVGSTLNSDSAQENFSTDQDAAFFAEFYKRHGVRGGHVILLNAVGSPMYDSTKAQALSALRAAPGYLQVGGGITPENAEEFLMAGASHVIVTSYVFRNGKIDFEHLKELKNTVGRECLVLDLSCRKRGEKYYVVTDRWQKFTETQLSVDLLKELERYASEYLIHATDVEGRASGIETDVLRILGGYDGVPATYAGGVRSMEDLMIIRNLGYGKVNVTVGSALDLFGGKMSFDEILKFCAEAKN